MRVDLYPETDKLGKQFKYARSAAFRGSRARGRREGAR